MITVECQGGRCVVIDQNERTLVLGPGDTWTLDDEGYSVLTYSE